MLFAGLKLELHNGWIDVTDDLQENAPYTLGLSIDALGALQFSVARYKEGKHPEISFGKLQELLTSFFLQNKFEEASERVDWFDGVTYVRGDHVDGNVLFRIWYVTDGKNIALVTYTTEQRNDPNLDPELKQAEEIVRSIRF